ncbi:hypothetical protein GWI33_014797 [Rhynchophorus ferrugineus]|uniref:Uncharacterized protein n=1 Tax=Rhynchophorus ferrugineus TaxID=354439 RepID=A0A834I6M4_RHYFE|nr:hypothetical protein GWI33_014797 [Rhynchophorus ferrugineus]
MCLFLTTFQHSSARWYARHCFIFCEFHRLIVNNIAGDRPRMGWCNSSLSVNNHPKYFGSKPARTGVRPLTGS